MSNSKLTTGLKALGATCLLAISSVSHAQITALSDDFESYGTAGVPGPADFAPWGGFSDNCGFPGGYSFVPSTTGPGISALAYNGVDNQYWNVYAQYENAPCHTGAGPNTQEAISVFREMTFTSTDTAGGDTWVFSFQYREADVPPAGSSEVGAFIRVFDPVFNLLYEATLDTSGSAAWQEGKLLVTLDPLWLNGSVQIGFNNLVGGYEDSGMFYDDVDFAQAQDVVIDLERNKLHFNHDGSGSNQDDKPPVAVFGATLGVDGYDLDTDDIIESSVRFGPGLAGQRSGESAGYGLNISPDGQDDARFRFDMSELGFDKVACFETSATLTAELTTGETIAGSDTFTQLCNAGCH